MAKLTVLARAARLAVDCAEQFLGGHIVDVRSGPESLLQLRHVGHVRGKPQLDLAIVGAHQHMAGLGDKGIADLPADVGADRDVLQVRLGRGQPPGLRPRQAVAGVDPPSLAD